MIPKDTLDLVMPDVTEMTEMTEQDATQTRGGCGPFASICMTFGLISQILMAAEAGLEGSGQVVGGGA